MVAVQNKLSIFIRISIFWVKKKKTITAIDIEFNCLVVTCNVNTFIINKTAYFVTLSGYHGSSYIWMQTMQAENET